MVMHFNVPLPVTAFLLTWLLTEAWPALHATTVCANMLVSRSREAPRSDLIKLFKVHLPVAVQIKHFEGDLEIPLRSWTQTHTHIHTKETNQKSMQHNIKAYVLTALTGVVNPVFDITATGLQNDCHKITTSSLLGCSTKDLFSSLFLFK